MSIRIPIVKGPIEHVDYLKEILIKKCDERIMCGLPLLNRDVIFLLEVDLIIRNAAKDRGLTIWNDRYFVSNVQYYIGQNVIEKTMSFIKRLEKIGTLEEYNWLDYPLRNAKHVCDELPDDLIESCLPAINDLLDKYWQEWRDNTI